MTGREQAILRVVIDPAHATTTQVEKAAAVPCAYSTFTRILGDPWFRRRVVEAIDIALGSELPAIVGTAIQAAKLATSSGFRDRKMLLTIAGIYSNRTEVRHSGEVVHHHRLTDALNRREAALQQIAGEGEDGLTAELGAAPLPGPVIDGEYQTLDDLNE